MSLEQDVKDYVNEKIKNGEIFTAFNITSELCAAKHRYVKPIVHAMYDAGEMGTYIRDVDSSIDGSPFRYSPAPVVAPVAPWDANNPDHPDYCLDCSGACSLGNPTRKIKNRGNTAPAVSSVPVSPTAVPQTVTLVNGVTLNEGGTRIRVLKDTLKAAGFSYGSVYAVVAGNSIILSSIKPTNSGLKTVTAEVDNRQNLRLNLAKLGVNGSKFTAKPSDGMIVIEVK